jgi:C4-dicarboxylate transporter DctQ subunit
VLGRLIARLEEALLALLLAAMTLLTFTQVVLRYLFNTGLIWALEATVYLFAWLILLGISYGVRVHAHIGVDILVKALAGNARRLVGLVAIGLSLLYTGIMLYGSWRYVERLHRLGTEAEDIPVERWILTIVLPIGFFLLGLRLLEQGVAILRGEAKGFELGDEAAELLRERERLVAERGR